MTFSASRSLERELGFSILPSSGETPEFVVKYFKNGIGKRLGPYAFLHGVVFEINNRDYKILIDKRAVSTALAMENEREAAERKREEEARAIWREREAKREPIRQAIERARNCQYLEEAISILSHAIETNSDADNVGDAKELLAKVQRDLDIWNRNTTKGLVLFNGEWVTPQQKQQAQVQDYIVQNYGKDASVFRTEQAASEEAMQFNRVEKSYVDNRTARIELWNEYGMSGAQHPGSPVTFHIARVTYDNNIGGWVVYYNVLATF